MADITGAVGQIAGAAASGPLGGVAAVLDAAKGIIGKFVTDPSQKLEASQHLVDLQYQLQMAQLEAETKDVQASAGANSDRYLGRLRAFYGYSMTLLYLWNYALCRFFHQQPYDIPMYVNLTFAALLLGFIGVPAAIEMLERVMGMPGDSAVKVLGVQVSNKS